MAKTVKKAEDPFSIDDLIQFIQKTNPKVDTILVRKAYEFSASAHKDQKRSSGEAYIHHPLEVAKILTEFHLDGPTIATGLLHDTVEDTKASLEDVTKEFGPEVAELVDGVTKISKITFRTSEEKQAENFRKMVIAMAKDIRVILVKLADRLHNMRTLNHLKPEKQMTIAQETLDIYSPLANRLGLSQIKRELEDLALRYTRPEIYYKLVEQVSKKLKERERYTEDVQKMIMAALKEHGYLHANVTGRPKHLFSIHKKMERRAVSYEQVYDIIGFRVLVESVEQCYGVLGLIHALWTPVPGRFKDYIAIPKANLYQSLHTTVVGPDGERIEIQIRTHTMHATAEHGIAAHWAYKEGVKGPQKNEQFGWLNRLVEWNRDLKDPNEFLETVKQDLFTEDVYVFTPKGQVMEFPQGSTPLDFAYSIHTDVGHRCIGAKINGRMVPLKQKLKSGDTVEVLTSPNQHPNKDWLKIVKSSRAKSKIRQYIKVEEHEKSKALGEMLLERALKRINLTIKSLTKDGSLQKVAESFSLKNLDDLFSEVGYGKVSIKKIITKLQYKTESGSEKQAETPLQKIVDAAAQKSPERQVVKVKGIDDLLVRFARCCSPVPGDSVVGFITRGRGISVHTRKCPKVLGTDPHRLVDIDWDLTKKTERVIKIRVLGEDRPGFLADLSQVIRDHSVNITNAQIGTTKDKKALCIFSVGVTDLGTLRKVISNLEAVVGVIRAERVQRKEEG